MIIVVNAHGIAAYSIGGHAVPSPCVGEASDIPLRIALDAVESRLRYSSDFRQIVGIHDGAAHSRQHFLRKLATELNAVIHSYGRPKIVRLRRRTVGRAG